MRHIQGFALRSRLVARRSVWLPTLWGWLVLGLLGLAAGLFAGGRAYGFLAPTEPVRAEVLVVEGWLGPAELELAARLWREHGYRRIVTNGGPIRGWRDPRGAATHAERAARYLVGLGVDPAAVVAVPTADAGRHRTYQLAQSVRQWAAQAEPGLRAFDVFSAGPHARRSRLLYRLAFGADVQVGIYAAPPSEYDASRWWRESAGQRDVFEQLFAYVWVVVGFWPDQRVASPRLWLG